jgi:hypothetical protein
LNKSIFSTSAHVTLKTSSNNIVLGINKKEEEKKKHSQTRALSCCYPNNLSNVEFVSLWKGFITTIRSLLFCPLSCLLVTCKSFFLIGQFKSRQLENYSVFLQSELINSGTQINNRSRKAPMNRKGLEDIDYQKTLLGKHCRLTGGWKRD